MLGSVVVIWAFWSVFTDWVVVPTGDTCAAARQAIFEFSPHTPPMSVGGCQEWTPERLRAEQRMRMRILRGSPDYAGQTDDEALLYRQR